MILILWQEVIYLLLKITNKILLFEKSKSGINLKIDFDNRTNQWNSIVHLQIEFDVLHLLIEINPIYY